MKHDDKFADFQKKSAGQVRLPPLKMNFHLLIQAFADENLETKELAAVLCNYPIITARLLGLANSPWASPVKPITNIETACVRLGFSMVKGLSLALAVAASFDTSRCPAFDPIRFWTTSLLVAEGGALLAARLPDRENYPIDFGYTVKTAGILHNLGLLWLADNWPREMDQALNLISSQPSLLVNHAVIQYVGIDYCSAGAWVFKQWGLPEELIEVVAHHRDKQYPEFTSTPVLLVGAVARMVSALFHEYKEIKENPNLIRLGIEFEQQEIVFNHLENKLESTKDLAKVVFCVM